MKLPGASQPVADLTRWNRSGLPRVRYVNGGAVEWLEYLRISHLLLYSLRAPTDTQLKDPAMWAKAYAQGVLDDNQATPVVAAAAKLNPLWDRTRLDGRYPADATYEQMLRAQYDDRALDQTRQISRAFARAMHVLTSALDAYANEGLLATATQPVHLRRLLDMIGYRPRPAASATVPVALMLKADAGPQTFKAGLAFDYNPGDGGEILVYESLDTVRAHPALNVMRSDGWDRPSATVPTGTTSFTVTQRTALDSSLAGTYALLGSGTTWEALRIDAVNTGEGLVTTTRSHPLASVPWCDAKLRFAPKVKLALRPHGRRWLHFSGLPKSYPGQSVFVEFESNLDWSIVSWRGGTKSLGSEKRKARVEEVRGPDLLLDHDVLGDVTTNGITAQSRNTIITALWPTKIKYRETTRRDENNCSILEPSGEDKAEELGEIGIIDTSYCSSRCHALGSRPPEIADNAPLVCLLADGSARYATVTPGSIQTSNAGFSFKIDGVEASRVVAVHTGFATEASLSHGLRSTEPLFDSQGRMRLALSPDAINLIGPGRLLLIGLDPDLAPADQAPAPVMAATVSSVTTDGATLLVGVSEDTSSLKGLTRGSAVVHGNVVLFGHGRTAAAKALGSGDNSVERQSFAIDDKVLATRPDPGFAGGAVPDLEVTVAGRIWRQVADLRQAAPEDPSYTISIDTDGRYRIAFNQRLPTGKDNVILTRRRLGAGDRGNVLPAGRVTNLKPKHGAIDAVYQPLKPQFGADMEDVTALRSQGATHFALSDRAVAVGDYAVLAESHSGVWHAYSALSRAIGPASAISITLTVVPAGGGAVAAIRSDLSAYMLARCPPGVIVQVQDFGPIRLGGTAVLTLKSGYARAQSIIDDIRAVLIARFGLKARRLGQTLYLSEIVAAIEEHEAVENVTLNITTNAAVPVRTLSSAAGSTQAVFADPTQSVFLDDPSAMAISFAGRGGP